MENTTNRENGKFSNDIIQIDVKRWLWKLLSHWWLFLLCLAIAIPCGRLYLRYTTFQYSSRAILMIKDAGRSGGISEKSILLEKGLKATGKSMDNVIQVLKSLTLMEKVVEKLGFNITYYRQGKIKESELYYHSPILLDSFTLSEGHDFGLQFYLELKDYNSFILKMRQDDVEEEGIRYSFGIPFENKKGRFTISLNPDEAIVPGQYRLAIRPMDITAHAYKSKLQVQRIGNQMMSSVLELKILDPVPDKARDVINTLIQVYNEEEIRDKNEVLRNTLKFIDNRVTSLVTELDSVEGGIEQFKSANAIISENASSSMDFTLGEIRSAIQQISQFEIQKNILASLERFLSDDGGSFELIPANLIAENPILSGLVDQYNVQALKRDRLATTASKKNPALINLENEMIDIRSLILRTIQNLQVDLEIPIAKIEKNIEGLRSSMRKVPGVEKRLLEQKRTQTIKENLFLYLLQKREETTLSEATTTASTRIIDEARTPKFAVYPKRKLIQMSSILLGLLVPLIIIILRGFFETRIESEDTIKQLTNIPILGRIALSKKKEDIVVKSGDRSAINEMFRLLRTNLNFVNLNQKRQAILVTSSISSEGKSFIAINLGITLALANKKVIILGLDLRKPKMAKYLVKESSTVGITNYLIGQNSLEEIIQQYPENPNLSFISSGPIPPNPAELLMSDQMEQLLEQLFDRYEYVLMDTPPVGLVSDALLLRKYASKILIVVRQKYTRKAMVKNLEEMYKNGELSKASIVFNGVKSGGSYYGYGGYQYGYGQGYYTDEKA